jgi:hypothetical protein
LRNSGNLESLTWRQSLAKTKRSERKTEKNMKIIPKHIPLWFRVLLFFSVSDRICFRNKPNLFSIANHNRSRLSFSLFRFEPRNNSFVLRTHKAPSRTYCTYNNWSHWVGQFIQTGKETWFSGPTILKKLGDFKISNNKRKYWKTAIFCFLPQIKNKMELHYT